MSSVPYLLLSDLLNQPELLQPPPVIVPKLAWEGRVSLLAAEEKAGKSTLAGQAAAHLVRGAGFLGGMAPARTVLWLALDEPLGDLVRRLHRYGARKGIAIMQERPPAALLQQAVEDLAAGLVVVDTLSEFADGLVDDMNAAEQWTPHLRLLRSIGQSTGAAVLLLHHTNRATGKYRGSGQIGAGVDAILEMSADAADPALRLVKSRGRVAFESFRIRYSESSGYSLEESGELSIELRLYRIIEANPGINARRLRDQVPGRNDQKDAALESLLRRGAIEDRGSAKGRSYFVRLEAGHAGARPGHASGHTDSAEPGARSGHASGHTNSESRKSFGANDGHAWGTPPTTPVCPDPLGGGSGAHTAGESLWAHSGAPSIQESGPGLEAFELGDLEHQNGSRPHA